MKFKIGDKVVCVNNPDGKVTDDNKGRGSGWKLGMMFVIDHITNGQHSKHILWPTDGGGIYDDFVRLASWKSRFEVKK